MFFYKYFPIYNDVNWRQNKKRQYACQRYRNLSEEEKTKSVNMIVNDIEIFLRIKIRLTEYRKNYYN